MKGGINMKKPHCGSTMGRTKYDPTWVDEAEALSAILDEDW